jgi:hypothetical protein
MTFFRIRFMDRPFDSNIISTALCFWYVLCNGQFQIVLYFHILQDWKDMISMSVIYFYIIILRINTWETAWSWLHGSWIYNSLCNQYISPVTCEFESRSGDTTLCDKFCQWLATGRWFFPGTLVSSTNKTDSHNVTEILLKVALNTISHKPIKIRCKISILPPW